MVIVKNYSANDFLQEYNLLDNETGLRILNAGSSNVRYGENCINIDIQKKTNVDFICDVHDLPKQLGKFDVIICNAVLQYCYNPTKVASEFSKVLNDGGLLFIDAPWVQPYCPDTTDKYRFSETLLQEIFSDFTILKSGPSICSGSALVFLAMKIAKNMSLNKYINVALSKFVGLLLFPLCWIKTKNESYTAGAFYLVCQKAKK